MSEKLPEHASTSGDEIAQMAWSVYEVVSEFAHRQERQMRPMEIAAHVLKLALENTLDCIPPERRRFSIVPNKLFNATEETP